MAVLDGQRWGTSSQSCTAALLGDGKKQLWADPCGQRDLPGAYAASLRDRYEGRPSQRQKRCLPNCRFFEHLECCDQYELLFLYGSGAAADAVR